MNGGRQWIAPAIALGAIVAAMSALFSFRLGAGDVFPEYSSLRADALGTRALFEALEQLPELNVDRDYHPLEQLRARPRTVLLPGNEWQAWTKLPVNKLRALNTSVQGGARFVIGFRADAETGRKDEESDDDDDKPADAKKKSPAHADPEKAKAKPAKDEPAKKPRKLHRPGIPEWEEKELAKEWGVTIKRRWLMDRDAGALRDSAAPDVLPASITWKSDVYFELPKDSPWRVLYRRAKEPVLIEKTFGRGSIVLLADSFCLSNEAMQKDRATSLMAWLVGEHRTVTFLEGELGVTDDTGVGALARRYGLGGSLALAVLLGALYVWRRQIEFVPRRDEPSAANEVRVAHGPADGVTALLQRALGAERLMPACLDEWRRARGATPAVSERLETAWRSQPAKQRPATAYNALVRALKIR